MQLNKKQLIESFQVEELEPRLEFGYWWWDDQGLHYRGGSPTDGTTPDGNGGGDPTMS